MTQKRRQWVFTCIAVLLGFFLVVAPLHRAAAAEHSTQKTGWSYNADYVYGMTRGVRDNRDAGAGIKMTIMPVTIVLDTLLLPFAAIAGLFGQPN